MTDTNNWLLYYKFLGDRPVEFADLCVIYETCRLRSGAVKTWGTCEKQTFANLADARADFHRRQQHIASAGFVLSREWRYDPAAFDFEQLAVEIKDASRRAFQAVRDVNPGQSMNAFALLTDGGVMTIVPRANSVQAFQAAGNNPDAQWNTCEWSFDEGNEYFDVAYRMLLTQHQELPTELPFREFKSGAVEAFIKALEQLDREGFFGTGPEREKNILLVQIADSDYIDDAVRRLNTPEAYRRFREWWESWN